MSDIRTTRVVLVPFSSTFPMEIFPWLDGREETIGSTAMIVFLMISATLSFLHLKRPFANPLSASVRFSGWRSCDRPRYFWASWNVSLRPNL